MFFKACEMARVPFLVPFFVSLDVCRFFPSRRSQTPLTPGPSPLADATYRGETLTEREGLPAGKAGSPLAEQGMETAQ